MIFWEFIEAERNNVLKAYESTVGVNITVRPGALWFDVKTGESGGDPPGPTTYEAFVRSGPFQGRDPIGLCVEAVKFWQEYPRRTGLPDCRATRAN